MTNPEILQFTSGKPFAFIGDSVIPELDISYETYGTLNSARDNAILLCHFFSGNKHAAGFYPGDKAPGWWHNLIGPDKPFDTNRYFIISSDSLCCLHDSDLIKTSGPRSINPSSGKIYGPDFPVTSVRDMVNAQKLLLDYLGVGKLHAVAGPSMGGMQALQWSLSYPEMVERIIAVTTGPGLDGFARFLPMRQGIDSVRLDPEFHGGRYYEHGTRPLTGLANALAALTLLARPRGWGGNYLSGYQAFEDELLKIARSRALQYDANCFIQLCRTNIGFNLFEGNSSPTDALKTSRARYLLIAETNDVLFPIEESRKFGELLAKRNDSEYHEFSSADGHLGGVTHTVLFAEQIRKFLS